MATEAYILDGRALYAVSADGTYRRLPGDWDGTTALARRGERVYALTSGVLMRIDPETGRYTDTHYIASFVGFVPADKPRLAIAVAIDEPMAGTYAGGSVAAPLFRRVAEMSLRYLGVTPEGVEQAKLPELAAFSKKGDPAAEAYRVVGEIQGKSASAGAGPTEPVVARRKPKEGEVATPDLAGYPVREAIQRLVSEGLSPRIEGSGRVLRQDPPAGAVVPRGQTVTLVLEPPA